MSNSSNINIAQLIEINRQQAEAELRKREEQDRRRREELARQERLDAVWRLVRNGVTETPERSNEDLSTTTGWARAWCKRCAELCAELKVQGLWPLVEEWMSDLTDDPACATVRAELYFASNDPDNPLFAKLVESTDGSPTSAYVRSSLRDLRDFLNARPRFEFMMEQAEEARIQGNLRGMLDTLKAAMKAHPTEAEAERMRAMLEEAGATLSAEQASAPPPLVATEPAEELTKKAEGEGTTSRPNRTGRPSLLNSPKPQDIAKRNVYEMIGTAKAENPDWGKKELQKHFKGNKDFAERLTAAGLKNDNATIHKALEWIKANGSQESAGGQETRSGNVS